MNKITLIIGFGISGKAAAILLKRQGRSAIIVDRNALHLQTSEFAVFGEQDLLPWNEIEQVILSPGVSPQHPLVREAKFRKLEVIGEIEFAFRQLSKSQRCIGITGTNGKTTTALLVAHILNASGRKAKALGNIGNSLSTYALLPDPEEILVVELSSFQLETLEMQCLDTAAFLNLTPDHLDRYESLEDYAKAKSRIQQCLKPNGVFWVSSALVREFGHLLHLHCAPKMFDEIEVPNLAGISPMMYIRMGVPEQQNCQAAIALVRHFGVTHEECQRAIAEFRKPAHRIEFVCEWNGIAFYNDSKGTNVDAVLYAIRHLEGPILLLAGGVDKGASYFPWVEAFKGKVCEIVAFGPAAEKMEQELRDHFPFERRKKMEEALLCAMKKAQTPLNIVLSPGCSSFDEFRNYEHRGNEFKRMVQEKIWIEKRRS